MNTVKCPNCGNENRNTNIRCEFCNRVLNSVSENDHQNLFATQLNNTTARKILYVFLLCSFAPFFFMGLIFIGVSTYFKFLEYHQSKNYLKTTGNLINYEKCVKDGLCQAVYEYEVNGIIYSGTPNYLSDESKLKEHMIIKYNPNDPSQYIIASEWNDLFIAGIVMVVLFIIMIIVIIKSLKKIKRK